jgi:quercetin dioxygenase-like cupin family protein
MSLGQEQNVALGPIGDRVIFENELVRVWSLALAPGEKQSWHRHHLPYLIVPLTRGKGRITFLDGAVLEPVEEPGMAIWREPGQIHELLNTADWEYQNLLIEIKQDTRAEKPPADQRLVGS